MAQNESEIRYLTPPTVEIKKKKYCRFTKESSNRCEESKTSCFVALLNRLDEIILRKEDTNGDNIIDRYSKLRT